MKDMITFKELLAVIVRRGRSMLLFMLICAVLLGGYRGISLKKEGGGSTEEIQAKYEEAQQAYEAKKAALTSQIERLNRFVESQNTYNENSILMQIAPCNEAYTVSTFAISGTEERSAVAARYLATWRNMDLQKLLTGTSWANAEEKYLREVMTLTEKDGILTLEIIGMDTDATAQAGQLLTENLMKQEQAIVSDGAAHVLSNLGSKTYVRSDTGMDDSTTVTTSTSSTAAATPAQQTNDKKTTLAQRQEQNLTTLQTYEKSLETAKKNLSELQSPSLPSAFSTGTVLRSMVKYAILGVVIGLIIGGICVVLAYLFRGCVETSHQIEKGLKIPFFGAVSPAGNKWNRWADRIIGERSWQDQAQALAYAGKSAAVHLKKDSAVALLASMPSAELTCLADTLRNQGLRVSALADATHAPETFEAVSQCDAVVLAERLGVSRCAQVEELAELAQQLNKPLVGFVLI